MAPKTKLDPKAKFNALANAKHIFSFKEEGIAVKLLDIVRNEGNLKAVVELEDGAIEGLFTDSNSAIQALLEVQTVFGDDQPFFHIHTRETEKTKLTVYYVEII